MPKDQPDKRLRPEPPKDPFGDFQYRQALAEEMLPMIGRIYRSNVHLLLYGKPLGPEPEELYRDGGSAVSYLSLTGYSRAPTTFNVQPSRIVDSADTIGNTYVSLLSNLNYGTGSLNYATNANYSLMKGVQIPKIQYS